MGEAREGAFQQTFYGRFGDMTNLDNEINEWLRLQTAKGYQVFSRDQISNSHDDGVYVTFCMISISEVD